MTGRLLFILLGFLLLLAAALYGSSWYLRAHLKIHLNVQIPWWKKGQEFPVEIWVENTGFLPMPKIRLTLIHDSDYVGKPEKKTTDAWHWSEEKKNGRKRNLR